MTNFSGIGRQGLWPTPERLFCCAGVRLGLSLALLSVGVTPPTPVREQNEVAATPTKAEFVPALAAVGRREA